jgi:hypothetical protein
MSQPVKQESSEPQQDIRAHLVKWDVSDWEGIEEAARIMSERDHLDLNPTDIIRKGTRELVKRCRESIIADRRAS